MPTARGPRNLRFHKPPFRVAKHRPDEQALFDIDPAPLLP
jgi:hypothetical protein